MLNNSEEGMYIAELWRYPVKSLAGEQLEAVELLAPDGIAQDRQVLVLHAESGHVMTSRTYPKLLGLKGTLGPEGDVLINGLPWESAAALALVQAAAGKFARLMRWDDLRRFDILPLLVATDGAVAAFGHDRRRLRPNIVVGGVSGLAERGWLGKKAQVGAGVVAFAQLRERCVMTTYDPDTQVQDHGVLRRIVREFGGRLALDTAVEAGGRIAVGDRVRLLGGGE